MKKYTKEEVDRIWARNFQIEQELIKRFGKEKASEIVSNAIEKTVNKFNY